MNPNGAKRRSPPPKIVQVGRWTRVFAADFEVRDLHGAVLRTLRSQGIALSRACYRVPISDGPLSRKLSSSWLTPRSFGQLAAACDVTPERLREICEELAGEADR